jgi:hypothetical protein
MTTAHTGKGKIVVVGREKYLTLVSAESLELLKIEILLVPVQEAVPLRAEDVGHLHGGSAHFCRGRW